MKRIASSNVAENLFGPGKDGFQPGNPALNLFATFLTDDWCNDLQEELMNVIETSGQVEDGNSRVQVLEAVRRLTGRKVSVATAGANLLEPRHLGLVICDASAGNITLTLTTAALHGASFRFKRLDSSANTVTIQRAGGDTIDGSATSFTLDAEGENRELMADGLTKWYTISGGGSGLPIGSLVPVTGLVLPTGCVWPDGSLLSRTTYSRLWAYAQASSNLVNDDVWGVSRWGSYSNGDGLTNFRIPDIRGEWVQVLDQGRGLDPGRVIGSWADQGIQSHNHNGVVLMLAGGDDGDISGYAVHGESTGGRAQITVDGSYVGNAGGSYTRPRGLAFPFALKIN